MQSRSWPGLQVSQGWTERGSTSKLIPVSADRAQVLPGYWSESISSWYMDHSVRLLRTGQNKKSERERGQERVPRTEGSVL